MFAHGSTSFVDGACSVRAHKIARAPSRPCGGSSEGSIGLSVSGRKSCNLRLEYRPQGMTREDSDVCSPYDPENVRTWPYRVLVLIVRPGQRLTYIRGARCAEYSQCRMSKVLALPGVSNSRSASFSLSQKLSAPSMCPPLYSYSNRQSMITLLS